MAPYDRHRAAADDLARTGGRDAAVKIVEYDPAWPAAFQAECERLEPLLEGAHIHCFGSTAVPGLAAALPLSDATADLCVCYSGLHVVEDPGAVLAEIARCLKPGGEVVGTTFLLNGSRRQRFLMRRGQQRGEFAASGTGP
jgi:SAM-dependent methyltransferase